MTYLNCPNCGLTLAMRGLEAEPARCPRCIARQRKLVGMLMSADLRRRRGRSSSEPPRVMRPAPAADGSGLNARDRAVSAFRRERSASATP
jgi:hypothetical protein